MDGGHAAVEGGHAAVEGGSPSGANTDRDGAADARAEAASPAEAGGAAGQGHTDSGSEAGSAQTSRSPACALALTGLPSDTRCVESCADLDAIRASLAGIYALAADIDCSGNAAFLPIGTLASPFVGALHGNGHVIDGLTVGIPVQPDPSAGMGLFGATSGAQVDELRLSHVNVTGPTSAGVGGLVGHALLGTTIARVHVDGSVSANDLAGGVAGELAASMLVDSYASASVSASTGHAGLLVGSTSAGSSVTDCYANGVLPGSTGVLVSDRTGSTLSAAFFDCDVAGGCNGSDPTAVPTLDLEISNRFLFAGWDFTRVWGSAARPADPAPPVPAPPPSPGFAQFSLPCLRWETGCTQRPVPEIAMPGDGRSTSTPFLVQTCAQLQAIKLALGARYSLQNDIDCTGFDFGDGLGFSPIGSSPEPFTGVLDGNGHTVTGLRLMRPRQDGAGMIGVAAGATIQNLTMARAVVMGGNGVGVLVGNAQRSRLLSCQVAGILAARSLGGGAIGQADAATHMQDIIDNVSVSNFQ
jgi:hypothetical protein